MKRLRGVMLAGTLLLPACMDTGADEGPETQGDCLATDARVGHRAVLAGRAHGVGGTVEVVDDCTLVVRAFTYDGGGVNVRFYGAAGSAGFQDGTALTGNLLGSRQNVPVQQNAFRSCLTGTSRARRA